jgi:hypothetical protein
MPRQNCTRLSHFIKKARGAKNTGEVALSGVVSVKPDISSDCLAWYGVVVGLLNSECSQQNSANKNKRGAQSQHIQFQGKVHGRASLVEVASS